MLRSVSFGVVAAMTAAVLVLSSLGAEKAAKTSAAAASVASVEEAREHVHQALLAETLGNNEERSGRLAKALLSDPGFPAANWHAARIQLEGQWLSLSQVVNRFASSPELAKYHELREKAATPIALRDLARWCEKQEWLDRARLHYAQLLANPQTDATMQKEAVKKLDLQPVNGAWVTKEELKAREQQQHGVEAALARWRPRLEKLARLIDGEDFAARDRAIKELQAIDDPQVIAALESFLQDGGDRLQEEAVKRLANFPQYEATQALVRYAVLSNFISAREVAVSALKQRPQHEYVPLLLAGLIAPIKSQYQIQWDRQGKVSYTHALLREAPSGNFLLWTQGLAVPLNVSSRTHIDATVRVYAPQKAESQSTTLITGKTPAEALQEQLGIASNRAANTETELRLANNAIETANQRVFETLEGSTGERLPRDPLRWWTWWQNYNEYYWPRPTSYVYESNCAMYYSGLSYTTIKTGTRNYSCFLAGTPVRTDSGTRPIETLQPGDRVLAQDQDSGELAYKVVINKTVRPPAKMVRIQAGGEEITTTLGHPFWVAGQGWRMAKQLKEGDLVHSLGGAVKVEKAEPLEKEEQAHNLVVDGFDTYFVGQAGLLVHDNEFRKPTRAVVPGFVSN